MVPTLSVLLALGLVPSARAAEIVVVPLDALPGPVESAVEAPPVRALVSDLDAQIQPGDETGVVLRWRVQVLERGWVDLPLVGDALAMESARLDDRPVSLTRAGDGWRRLAVELSPGVHTVQVRGSVDTPASSLQLPVARGVSGRLRASEEGLAFTVAAAVATRPGRWDLRPGETLDVRWAPERPPPPRPRVVTFDGAVALRGGEGGVEGAARLRYRVIDGTVSSLTLRIPGGVDQIEVRGRQVARHRVEGERVVVELTEPVSGRLQLDLEWRGAAPPASLGAAPVPQPQDARGTATVTLVRGDDSMLVPAPGRGMVPVATHEVPRWGRGLVAGQPLVAYRTDAAERADLQWQRLAWQPVDAPPTLVDEARYTVVHADHGRVHVRAAYQVRNDRNPFLRLRLPEGWEAVGVRVAGRTAEPVRSADGRWLVPLEKSVETLDGLVAFPVELMLVGDEPEWERRGLRALQTPAVDAPIAYARWEVRLPRAVQQRDVEGRPTLVDAWTPKEGGLLIGRATGTELDDLEDEDDALVVERDRNRRRGFGRKGAAAASEDAMFKERDGKEREKTGKSAADKAVSQEYWNRAYSAYKDNDFDEAESLLQQSLAYNSGNASAQSLQENVYVLRGEADLDAGQQAAANRVRELARARTGDVELAQAGKAEEAERKLRAGDRAGARAAYEELVKLTEQLAAVEQAEAVDQKSRLSAYRQQVAELGEGDGFDDANGDFGGRRDLASNQRSSGRLSGMKSSAPARAAPAKKKAEKQDASKRQVADDEVTVIDFEDISIEGELLKPQGALLLDRRTSAAPDPAPMAPSLDAPSPARSPAPAPSPAPPPPGQVLEKDFLERIPQGRSYQSAVQAATGVTGGATTEPGSVTIFIPETVEEEEVFDEVVGGMAFGLEGQGQGGGGVVLDPQTRAQLGAIGYQEGIVVGGEATGTSASDVPMPAEEPMPDSGAFAFDDAPMDWVDDDDLDGERRVRSKEEAKPVAVVEREPAAVSQSMEIASVRRRGRVGDALRNFEIEGRVSKPKLPTVFVVSPFPVEAPPPEAFPLDTPAAPAAPVARGPGPAPSHPTGWGAAVAFPLESGVPMPALPAAHGVVPPAFPRAAAAAEPWPLRPPPPPAAPFGLDVPDGITASTLSLSLPETGTGLLLEQRLLPPDEPLRLTLKYRNRR